MTPRLSLKAITKRYPPVVANDCVSVDVALKAKSTRFSGRTARANPR